MFSATLHLLQIKDLKDLRFFSVGVSIDMQVLKDLKRFFSRERSRGKPARMRVWHARAPALRN